LNKNSKKKKVDLSRARALAKEQNAALYRQRHSGSGMGDSNLTIGPVSSSSGAKRESKHERARRRSRVKPMSAFDLTDQLLKSDYFLDVNPRNLRRLINIIALTGRLLRAYHIDFNWRALASWIYVSEQWPYRTSWIVMYLEEHDSELDPDANIYEIYKLVKHQIPVNGEPLLELDRSSRKFEQFLDNSKPSLTLQVLKKVLPCTCNLDPLLIKLIKDSCDASNDASYHQTLQNGMILVIFLLLKIMFAFLCFTKHLSQVKATLDQTKILKLIRKKK
jgi:hypothetical protein